MGEGVRASGAVETITVLLSLGGKWVWHVDRDIKEEAGFVSLNMLVIGVGGGHPAVQLLI